LSDLLIESAISGENSSRKVVQQQARFGKFTIYINSERPRQPLRMRYPTWLYTKSPRPYKGLSDLDYPIHHRTADVTNGGRIRYKLRMTNMAAMFAGQKVSVKQVSDEM
jgi:putative transposase